MLTADVMDAERAETSYLSLISRAWPIILANAAVPTLGLVDTLQRFFTPLVALMRRLKLNGELSQSQKLLKISEFSRSLSS